MILLSLERQGSQTMDDPQARFEALVGRLQEQEYRLTPQRIALLRLLAASDGHPSAAHLYDQLQAQFPTTSLGTIYKTLNLLKDLDEVLELGFSDDDYQSWHWWTDIYLLTPVPPKAKIRWVLPNYPRFPDRRGR